MERSMAARNAGLGAFFLSGICAISTGVVVSLLQEQHGFGYETTGRLLAMMNMGNLLAGFAAGMLPTRLGHKRTVALLTAGYAAGYALMGLTGAELLLMLAFFLVGAAKGATLNTCTLLVGDNSRVRATGMNLMHACYACGALLCPFVIMAASGAGAWAPMAVLAVCGAGLWAIFLGAPLGGRQRGAAPADWDFLRTARFWLLTGLIFCQNAAETGVTSWMVTYFKGSGIIGGAMSAYTVTVMWSATLIARLLLAFVCPPKRPARAMIVMSLGCIGFYAVLMQAQGQTAALLLLFGFAFSMAGMNPTGVALAGRMTTARSLGVMLPAASSGAILTPWVIGLVAGRVSIGAGMAVNIVPCVGLLILSWLVSRLRTEEP